MSQENQKEINQGWQTDPNAPLVGDRMGDYEVFGPSLWMTYDEMLKCENKKRDVFLGRIPPNPRVMITYPFQFSELPISDTVLDILGFGPYAIGYNGLRYRIVPAYHIRNTYILSEYPFTEGSRKWVSDKGRNVYFLHDILLDLDEYYPSLVGGFMSKCKGNGLSKYVDSFIQWSTRQSREIFDRM